jgi:hypothetical protein
MNDFSTIVLASGLFGSSLLDLFERIDTESVATGYAKIGCWNLGMFFGIRSLSFSPHHSKVTYHSKVLVALSAHHTLGYRFEGSRFCLLLFCDRWSGSGTDGRRIVELIGIDRNTSLASFAYQLRSTRFPLSHILLTSLFA